MNTPNKLTFMRIIFTIIMIIILIFPFYSIGVEFPVIQVAGINMKLEYIIAGVIFLVASLTDFLDGYLARKNNQVTDLGKMLDAIADKALVNTALIILAYKGFIPVVVRLSLSLEIQLSMLLKCKLLVKEKLLLL